MVTRIDAGSVRIDAPGAAAKPDPARVAANVIAQDPELALVDAPGVPSEAHRIAADEPGAASDADPARVEEGVVLTEADLAIADDASASARAGRVRAEEPAVTPEANPILPEENVVQKRACAFPPRGSHCDRRILHRDKRYFIGGSFRARIARHRLYCSAFAGLESSSPVSQKRNQSKAPPCDVIRSHGIFKECSPRG